VSQMLQSTGASPVGMPPAEIYENLQKGVLDGLVTTWDLVGAIKLNEVLKYHTDARAYTAAFYFVMNKAKYDGLPPDVKKAIDETTGDAMVPKFEAWWAKWDGQGKEDAAKRGNEVITLTDAQRAEWRKALQPMIDAYLEGLKGQGVKDPQALYRRAQALVDKYE
jgi:TRAP-type C4-dicarboxylate transport system substrate-binding protein